MSEAHIPCNSKIFEKYRYNLIEANRLQELVKLSANKHNLVNITKSGLREVQTWAYHIINKMVLDLVQSARDGRGMKEMTGKKGETYNT